MDVFITLGGAMFYVSEYHNALFDDPDAYAEAVLECGLDISDSESVRLCLNQFVLKLFLMHVNNKILSKSFNRLGNYLIDMVYVGFDFI